METNQSQDTSTPDDVPWPIAPDGYVPNSVIRGWLKFLKRAKWGSDQDGDKDDEDEFSVGNYPANYMNLRARLRANAKTRKRSFMQWEYLPDLDEPVVRKYSSESDNGKEEIWSTDENAEDYDPDSSHLFGMKETKDGMERLGFEFALERRDGTTNEQNKDTTANTDRSYEQSKDKTEEEFKDEDASGHDKGQEASTEGIEVMTHGPIESQHNDTTSSDQFHQTEPSQQPTDEDSIDLETLSGDTKSVQIENDIDHLKITDVQIKNKQDTPSQQFTTKTQKTQLTKAPSEKIKRRKSKVSQKDLKEAKDPIDAKTKPSDANKQQATTEEPDISRLMDKPNNPPLKPPAHHSDSSPRHPVALADAPTPRKHKADLLAPSEVRKKSGSPSPRTRSKLSQPITESSSFPKPEKDPILAQVDKNVLGFLKQFKTAKWLSSKPQGKWSSTDLHPSKSKWSDSGTELEGQGTAQLPYQHGSGKEAGESSRPLDESGLWKRIIEGVSVAVLKDGPKDKTSLSMAGLAGMRDHTSPGGPDRLKPALDPDPLWELLQGRPKDQQSSADIRGIAGMMDQTSPGGPGSVKPPFGQNTLWELRQDGPRDRQTSRVRRGLAGTTHYTSHGGPGNAKSAFRENGSAKLGGANMSIDYAAIMRLLRDRGTRNRMGGRDMTRHTGFTDDSVHGRPTSARPMDGNGSRTVQLVNDSAPAVFVDGPGKEQHLGLDTISQAQAGQRWPFGSRTLEPRGGPGAESRDGSAFDQLERVRQEDISNLKYKESMLQRVTAEFDHTMGPYVPGVVPKDTAWASPGMMNQTSMSSEFHGFQYKAKDGLDGLVRPNGSPGHTGGVGASSKDESGTYGVSVHGSKQSAAGTMPEDKSQALLMQQMVRSKVHTPGLLNSMEPEQFLKVFTQNQHKDKTQKKSMPKCKKELYKLIFLYGFCSPQTAKLFAKEKHAQTQPKKHRENVELFQYWDAINSSVLHERVSHRVQFQDIMDKATTDFHCVIPLPSVNNFISLEKYGETEYGRLLFEWERGEEDEDQMKVVSVCTV